MICYRRLREKQIDMSDTRGTAAPAPGRDRRESVKVNTPTPLIYVYLIALCSVMILLYVIVGFLYFPNGWEELDSVLVSLLVYFFQRVKVTFYKIEQHWLEICIYWASQPTGVPETYRHPPLTTYGPREADYTMLNPETKHIHVNNETMTLRSHKTARLMCTGTPK